VFERDAVIVWSECGYFQWWDFILTVLSLHVLLPESWLPSPIFLMVHVFHLQDSYVVVIPKFFAIMVVLLHTGDIILLFALPDCWFQHLFVHL
jgi:hypothetical protein